MRALISTTLIHAFSCLAVFALLAGCSGESNVLYEWRHVRYGMHRMYDLEKVCMSPRGERSYEVPIGVSSGRAVPEFRPEHFPDDETVIFREMGPGCIYRIWIDDPDLAALGPMRMYLDRTDNPMTFDLREMFQGDQTPFLFPIAGAGQKALGHFSYLPIAFRQSIVMTLKRRPLHGGISYQLLSPDTVMRSHQENFSERENKTLERLSLLIQEKGNKPYLLKKTWKTSRTYTIPADDTQSLFHRKDGGVIRGLYFSLAPDVDAGGKQSFRLTAQDLRRLILSIYWDGESTPSVHVPLADLFACGLKVRPVASLPLGHQNGRFYFLLPMPFERECRISMRNTGKRDIRLNLDIVYQDRKGFREGMGRLHADFFTGPTTDGEPFGVCNISGEGHYVGTILNIQAGHGLECLDGAVAFTIDGAENADVFSETTRSYFNIPDNPSATSFSLPYHGAPLFVSASATKACHVTAYRFHLTDRIAFRNSLALQIHHAVDDRFPLGHYSAVSFWYRDGSPRPQTLPRPAMADLRIYSDTFLKTELIDLIESGYLEHVEAMATAAQAWKQPWLTWRYGNLLASLLPSRREQIEHITWNGRRDYALAPDEQKAGILDEALSQFKKIHGMLTLDAPREARE